MLCDKLDAKSVGRNVEEDGAKVDFRKYMYLICYKTSRPIPNEVA